MTDPAGGIPLDLITGHEDDAERAAAHLLREAYLQATDRGDQGDELPPDRQELVTNLFNGGIGMLVGLMRAGEDERIVRVLDGLEPVALRMLAAQSLWQLAQVTSPEGQQGRSESPKRPGGHQDP